jgi:hypothetical protein
VRRAQDGKTALDYAKQQGKRDVARLIEVRPSLKHTLSADIYSAHPVMPQCVYCV